MSVWLTGWLSSQKKPQVPLTAKDLGGYQEKAPVTTRYVTCTLGSLSQDRVLVPCWARQWLCPRTGILSLAVLSNGYVPGQGFYPLLCLAMAKSQDRDSVPCRAWQWLSMSWDRDFVPGQFLFHATPGNGYFPGQRFCPMPRLAMAINVNVPGLPSLCCLRSDPACLRGSDLGGTSASYCVLQWESESMSSSLD